MKFDVLAIALDCLASPCHRYGLPIGQLCWLCEVCLHSRDPDVFVTVMDCQLSSFAILVKSDCILLGCGGLVIAMDCQQLTILSMLASFITLRVTMCLIIII
jgi:hypothetical protein